MNSEMIKFFLSGGVPCGFSSDRAFCNFRLSSASSPVLSLRSVTWLRRAVGVKF
ncbi:MAG TPA: hypothetical protein ACHBZ9_09360 [Arsenophonus nasoniae]|uniref:hypothetical protein n=1 Tax=Arsenophonus nasoniae TaxID=638 RepID=UPI00387A4F81